MTYRELAATIFGIVFIVAGAVVFVSWIVSIDNKRMKNQAEEKQRIEWIEEENQLLQAKCGGTWMMELAEE